MFRQLGCRSVIFSCNKLKFSLLKSQQ